MSIINSQPLIGASGSTGYQIQRSVRLRASASAYLSRTPASAGSQTTWTWSGWVKRGSLGTRQFITTSGVSPNTTQVWQVEFNANNKLEFYNQTIGTYRLSTQVFRDSSAWYHIVFCADTNNATAQSRFRCWVNGVEITAWDTNSTISSGYSFAYNGAYLHGIGVYTYTPSLYLDSYLTEINFVDGQALTPSSFGETNQYTGVWQPKKYNGTYGTNGFYLNFSDNSGVTATTIGKDYSGNGNNWTPNNISVTAGATYDSMLDVPTNWADGGNGRGNYATLNPITPYLLNTTLSQGNLVATKASATSTPKIYGTIGIDSGQWYWEIKLTALSATGNYYSIIGIGNNSTPSGNDTASVIYLGTNDVTLAGYKQVNGTNSAYGANYVAGDVIGIAFDASGSQITFYKNGVSQGAISGLTATTYFPLIRTDGTSNSATFEANFGQRPFTYTPPTGFKALNTQNLPDPTIRKGSQYFDATTYVGNAGTNAITNSGLMQPDLVWIKSRGFGDSHALIDSVRGGSNSLYSNLTSAENAFSSDVASVTFNSNGFTVTGTGVLTNRNAANFIGWQWKEGATQGFDIVTYTGNGVTANTVAHSLGVTPSMIIVKERGTAGTNWMVKHKNLATKNNLFLQGINASTDITTAVAGGGLADLSSSSTFGFLAGTTNTDNVNRNGGNFVAYLFAEVPGFSKFGSYTGNGSADGAFVFTGFRPRLVMAKRTDSTSNWYLLDTSRNTYNSASSSLEPNLSNAEATNGTTIDFLSNGFKVRGTVDPNVSGGTYIYMAFAETPFKYSLAR